MVQLRERTVPTAAAHAHGALVELAAIFLSNIVDLPAELRHLASGHFQLCQKGLELLLQLHDDAAVAITGYQRQAEAMFDIGQCLCRCLV